MSDRSVFADPSLQRLQHVVVEGTVWRVVPRLDQLKVRPRRAATNRSAFSDGVDLDVVSSGGLDEARRVGITGIKVRGTRRRRQVARR